MIIEIHKSCLHRWKELYSDRSGFQAEFCSRLLAEEGFQGRVLDIGCGAGLPAALKSLSGRWGRLDGVEPSDSVLFHPDLEERWQAEFERSLVPDDAYDLAYAYNVAEHVARPDLFLRKAHSVLKPGGVFWALTSNAGHPFVWLTSFFEKSGLKGTYSSMLNNARHSDCAINDYPSYYRMNSVKRVSDMADRVGFAKAEFFFYPCLQWDRYFPALLRWMPHLYDAILGTRHLRSMLVFYYRLETGSGK